MRLRFNLNEKQFSEALTLVHYHLSSEASAEWQQLRHLCARAKFFQQPFCPTDENNKKYI